MNSLEVQYNLTQELKNYLDDLVKIGLTSNIMEYYVNDSIDQIFNAYYKEFQKNEAAGFGIDTLIKSTSIDADETQPDNIHTNGIVYTLPSAAHRTTHEYIMRNGAFVKVKPITYDYYNANINNIKRKPYSDMYWRLNLGDDSENTNGLRREIIHDGNATKDDITYYITYIKKPTKVSFGTTTGTDVGYKPMKEAIKMASQNIIKSYLGKYQNNNK